MKTLSTKAGSRGRKLNQSFLIFGKGIRANGSACWHVHGDFFDILLDLNAKIVISAGAKKIYKNEYGQTVGNWEDWNIGSVVHPIYYSEACECDTYIPIRTSIQP